MKFGNINAVNESVQSEFGYVLNINETQRDVTILQICREEKLETSVAGVERCDIVWR